MDWILDKTEGFVQENIDVKSLPDNYLQNYIEVVCENHFHTVANY